MHSFDFNGFVSPSGKVLKGHQLTDIYIPQIVLLLMSDQLREELAIYSGRLDPPRYSKIVNGIKKYAYRYCLPLYRIAELAQKFHTHLHTLSEEEIRDKLKGYEW